jgi:hypothetical protein
MRAQAFPGENPETVPPPDSVTEIFVALAEDACEHHGARLKAKDHRGTTESQRHREEA